MRAIVQDAYGPANVLQLMEIALPEIGEHQVPALPEAVRQASPTRLPAVPMGR